jgi:hypothetical protein
MEIDGFCQKVCRADGFNNPTGFSNRSFGPCEAYPSPERKFIQIHGFVIGNLTV